MAFQYESSIDSLLARQIIDVDIATTSRKKFYNTLNEEKLRTSNKIRDYREIIRLYTELMTCKDMVSLTELAKQYSDESPGYINSKVEA